MPNHVRKPRHPARLTARAIAAILLAGLGTATIAIMTPAVAAATSQAPENTAASEAVRALLAPSAADAAALIPADFSELMGYRPVLDAQLLTNPEGGCSSPVPLPATFTGPCRAHDLGYDLLRYAQLAGGELAHWARQGLDAQFAARLRQVCASGSSAGCSALASAASAAVDANSWRQSYAVPTTEPVALYALGGIGLASAATALTARRGPLGGGAR